MLELGLHEKIIAQVDRVGVQRIKLILPCGVGVKEKPLGGLGTGKFMQPLEEIKDRDSSQHQHRQRRGEDRRMARCPFQLRFAPGSGVH